MKFLQRKTRRLAVPDGKLFLKSDIKHKGNGSSIQSRTAQKVRNRVGLPGD